MRWGAVVVGIIVPLGVLVSGACGGATAAAGGGLSACDARLPFLEPAGATIAFAYKSMNVLGMPAHIIHSAC